MKTPSPALPTPLPQVERESSTSRAPSTARAFELSPSPPSGGEGRGEVVVAYHAGPPEIGFYKRQWRIGVAQPIPVDDWIAMNERADFGEFDFKEEA